MRTHYMEKVRKLKADLRLDPKFFEMSDDLDVEGAEAETQIDKREKGQFKTMESMSPSFRAFYKCSMN